MMKLILPKSRDEISDVVLDGYNSMVVIGANGSGKSRFGTEIIKKNKNAVKISALNSLYFFVPDRKNKVKEQVLEVCNEIEHLSEFERLKVVLMQDEIEASMMFRQAAKSGKELILTETRFDKLRRIWSKLLPYSQLIIQDKSFRVKTSYDINHYDINRLSDSEKIIFYLIGSVLLLPPNAIAVIDEPELHINESVLSGIWDELEMVRSDCSFVYLTHNIDFALSRINAKKFWIKSVDFENHIWDYGEITSFENIPEDLYMEILGSRKPLLFIEGTEHNSIDSKLYPFIFTDHTVKALGGCTKVIETTKAFAEQLRFHLLKVHGIVDRDRRTDDEVDYLRRNNIYVPEVAEVENFLMLEPVIKAVANRMLKNPDIVFSELKQNVLRLFQEDLQSQALLHTRHRVRRQIELMIDRRVSDISELEDHISKLTENYNTKSIYESLMTEFQQYIHTGDYNAILRVYNQKGLLPRSRILQMCGISTKDAYITFVLSLLKEDKKEAIEIRKAIKEALLITDF